MTPTVVPLLKSINRMVSLSVSLLIVRLLEHLFHVTDCFSCNLCLTFRLESCRMMKDLAFYVRSTSSIAFKIIYYYNVPRLLERQGKIWFILLTDLLQERPRPCHFYEVSCQMLILKLLVIMREKTQTRAKSVFRQMLFTCLDLNYVPGTPSLFIL